MFTFPLSAFILPAASTILGWFLFGCIGTIAVGYAKLKEEWLPAVIGVALMIYPYFLSSGLFFWIIGVGLTITLFVPRRCFGL